MKEMKKVLLAVALLVICWLGIPSFTQNVDEVSEVKAATAPSLNKKKATIKYGKKVTLIVKNPTKKVKWVVKANAPVRIVKTAGKKNEKIVLQGIQKGKATVTAKMGKKTLKATITVKHTHNYLPATCTEAAKCVCGVTSGPALGHQLSGATCQKAATCIRCGYTEGTISSHLYVGGKCMWCNELDLCSVVDFELSRTALQGDMDVRYVSLKVKNYGTSEFRITGPAELKNGNGTSITLYMTDVSDKLLMDYSMPSGYYGTVYFDTMTTNSRFTFLPDSKLVFKATYGGTRYEITVDVSGDYTFVKY